MVAKLRYTLVFEYSGYVKLMQIFGWVRLFFFYGRGERIGIVRPLASSVGCKFYKLLPSLFRCAVSPRLSIVLQALLLLAGPFPDRP